MKKAGLFIGILSFIGMCVALIPLLGWMNWFNIPFAVIGLIFSIIGKSKGGMIFNILAIVFGFLRLLLGGGLL